MQPNVHLPETGRFPGSKEEKEEENKDWGQWQWSGGVFQRRGWRRACKSEQIHCFLIFHSYKSPQMLYSSVIMLNLNSKYSPSCFQQVTPSPAGPSRLQVAAGFSWDMGLNSLKPASAAKDPDSSDDEDQEGGSKVRQQATCLVCYCVSSATSIS